MKAVRLHGVMDFRVDEIPKPSPGPGEVLVHTEYCGICGSDVPRALEGSVPFFPNTIGHEFCGTVEEVGEGVSGVKPGDFVLVMPLIVCHKCEHCRNGNFGQCVDWKFIGLRVKDKGGFAEYNVMPEVNLIKLPGDMDRKMAAFVEPTSVAIHGLSKVKFQAGKDLAVIGAGSVGQLAIQCSRAMGAKHIFVFDIDDKKLDFAKTIGADFCYNTTREGFLEQYLKDSGGYGVEQVLEVVGLEQTILLAVDVCKPVGRIALVGLLGKSVTFSSEYLRKINTKEVTMTGVWQCYSLNYPGDDWRLAIHYITNNIIDLKPMLYKVERMERANEVFAEYKIPGAVQGKIILTFSDTI